MYAAPDLATLVELVCSYSAPNLAVTVTLCPGEVGDSEGTMAAALPPPSIALAADIAIANIGTVSIAAALPPPSIALAADIHGDYHAAFLPPIVPTMTMAATGHSVTNAALSAALPPPTEAPPLTMTASEQPPRGAESVWANLPLVRPPPLTFRARERSIYVTVAADLPAPSPPTLGAAMAADYIHAPALAVSLPPPSMPLQSLIVGAQDLSMQDVDGHSAGRGARHQHGTHNAAALLSEQQHGWRVDLRSLAQQHQAAPLHSTAGMPHAHMLRAHDRIDTRAQHGITAHTGATAGHAEYLRHQRRADTRAQHGLAIRGGASAGHAEYQRTRNRLDANAQNAIPAATRLAYAVRQSIATHRHLLTEQQQAMWPLPGKWWPWYEAPPLVLTMDCTGDYAARPLACVVALCATQQPYCPGVDPEPPTIIVPIRSVYFVTNSFSLVRVDDSTPIDTLSFSASIDADSWTWGFSAQLPASQLDAVLSTDATDPVELLATINGTPIRLVVDGLTRERTFSQSSIRISGRGRAAWLGAPYSPIISSASADALTAQQAAALALTDNGASIGWAVDWQLEDWLIAANAWSYSGDYIGAIQRIAEAGGGYVQPHDTDPTLIVLPRYPVLPWDWSSATQDIALPENVVTTEGIEWQSKPLYDSVYIAGGSNGGRLDRIRRTGTAGTTPAQTIVDPLATDPIMTRQRGSRILADTGRQAIVTLKMPILPETGIIRPGNLIGYTHQGQERVGLSRSLSISHGFPSAWQTIGIETHESI